METRELFDRLVADHRPATLMKYTSALSRWDRRHYLPSGAGECRDAMNEMIEHEAHRLYIESNIGGTLEELEARSDLDEALTTWERMFVTRCRRSWKRARCAPASLMGALGSATSVAQRALSEASAAQDWSLVAPSIQRVIDLKRQEAECYLGAMELPTDDPDSLFAALFEEHEPGFPIYALRNVLREVRAVGPEFVAYARSVANDTTSLLNVPVSADQIRAVQERLPAMLDFDMTRGRIDFAPNPVTTHVGPDDVRITLCVDPKRWGYSIFPAFHELGHGIGKHASPNTGHWCNAIPALTSTSLSETSAILWDMYVVRHCAYLESFYPMLQNAFPHLAAVPLDAFHDDLHKPRFTGTTFIGTPMFSPLSLAVQTHIVMEIMAGRVTADDIPDATAAAHFAFFGEAEDEGLKKLLLTPHYPLGYFAYIPTYLLAHLAAPALVTKYREMDPTWAKQWASGNVSGLRGWLTEHVYPWNDVLNLNELLVRVTGRPINTAAWRQAVNEHYPLLAPAR